jgi:hypothetical protein
MGPPACEALGQHAQTRSVFGGVVDEWPAEVIKDLGQPMQGGGRLVHLHG